MRGNTQIAREGVGPSSLARQKSGKSQSGHKKKFPTRMILPQEGRKCKTDLANHTNQEDRVKTRFDFLDFQRPSMVGRASCWLGEQLLSSVRNKIESPTRW
jgi:hypothetical protein